MTPGEFRKIVKTMKEFGISHLKMGDLELAIGMSTESVAAAKHSLTLPHKPSEPIAHKDEHLSSLLKLSDDELVDQLFPDTTEKEESA